MELTTTVNWKTYAQTYDMLLTYNPYYQQLQQEVLQYVGKWQVPAGATLADIGAGTGNYSLAMARLFPQATTLHFDNDDGMNAQAAAKRSIVLRNHEIRQSNVDEIRLKPQSLSGLISIHALYTFPDPKAVLRNMYDWLAPGAPAVLVNAGRTANILAWQLAIGWHLLRHYGLGKTLEILREGKEVSRQNAYIRSMQGRGVFWTHTHQEFCEAVREAGFEIQIAKKVFRDCSDLVVVNKPA